jgi:putative membrane protein
MMAGIGMGFGGIGLILMLLFWGGLIFGGVWLVKTIFTSGQQNESRMVTLEQTSPRDILNQRYVRGEISKEEYDLIRADLI